jgi:copper resistance protein C
MSETGLPVSVAERSDIVGDSKRRIWTPGRRIAWVALTAILTLGIGSTPAWAHNSLVEALPAKDSVLQTAPPTVTLKFLATLKAGGATMTVTGPDGATAIGAATIDGKTISAPFTGAAGGLYQVSYDVVSTDGHPVKGSYTFTLQAASPSPAPSPSASPSPAANSTVVSATAPSPAAESDGLSTGGWLISAGLAAAVVAGGLLVLRRRARP